MDVRAILHRLVCLVVGCWMLDVSCRSAVADPAYSIIDLGTGNPIFGTDSSGNGTVMASYGTAYTFNPAQNFTSALLSGATQPVPTVDAAPGGYAEMPYAYSRSSVYAMNAGGLAAGINDYGVNGHLSFAQAFVTQLEPNGTWGGTTPLWAGVPYDGSAQDIGIIGVSSTGQVLGYGVPPGSSQNYQMLYVFDTRSGATTNITYFVNSGGGVRLPIPWISGGNDPNNALLDTQGRIIVQASADYTDPEHNLLLVPDGDTVIEAPVPEPATIGIFAALIGGWVALNRRRTGRASK